MNKFLAKDKVMYSFDPASEPVISIDQCEILTIETRDCFSEQITPEHNVMDDFDWGRINPATGPVYIRGVKPGDIVRIDILDITLASTSLMATIPDAGALGKHIVDAERTFLTHNKDFAILPTERGEVEIPLKPMIGVIGLMPKNQYVATGTPGAHGGNMDTRLVAEGSSIYLKAQIEGGLFACGDLHAVMGDGEVLICGAEASGEVTMRAEVVDIADLPTPLIENAGLYATVASAETLDEACILANDMMMEFLTDTVGLSANDAARLMSLVGNLRISQVVNPLKTARFEFPKWTLDDLGFTRIGASDSVCEVD